MHIRTGTRVDATANATPLAGLYIRTIYAHTVSYIQADRVASSCLLLLQGGEGRRRKLGQRKILHIQIEFSRYLLLWFAMGLGRFSDASAKMQHFFIFLSMMCLRGYFNRKCSQRERNQKFKTSIRRLFN